MYDKRENFPTQSFRTNIIIILKLYVIGTVILFRLGAFNQNNIYLTLSKYNFKKKINTIHI